MSDKAFWVKYFLAHPEDTERNIAEGWYDKPHISYAMWANRSKEEQASFTPEKQKQYHFLNGGVETQRQAIPEFKVQIAHRREVEKAREEQGFAKAREEAMGKSVVDLSRVFGERQGEGGRAGEVRVEATGLGIHQAVGEQSVRAKLTNEDAQKIRREYWAAGGGGGGGEVTLLSLGKKYGVSSTAALHVIHRKTWVHLPRVEGEPEENLKKLSAMEHKIVRKAKELGVEPVRSELGRLALPPDVVVKLRAEANEKAKATKSKKNAPAKE
jgi:hypothetical protein